MCFFFLMKYTQNRRLPHTTSSFSHLKTTSSCAAEQHLVFRVLRTIYHLFFNFKEFSFSVYRHGYQTFTFQAASFMRTILHWVKFTDKSSFVLLPRWLFSPLWFGISYSLNASDSEALFPSVQGLVDLKVEVII